MTSTNAVRKTHRHLLCFDRHGDESSGFYQTLFSGKRSGKIVCDLSQFLEEFASDEYDIGLLDTKGLLDAPTGHLSSLHEFRGKKPLGLMTIQTLEEYITPIRSWGILQTLPKSDSILPEEVDHFLLMLEDPRSGFGLISFLANTVEMYSLNIKSVPTKNQAIERVTNHFATCGFAVHELYDVRLILEELTNNALFHAFRNAAGEEKYSISTLDKLTPAEETVRIEYGSDQFHVGFSVTDNAGSLPVSVILNKIERQLHQEGIFDSSGRGLHLSQLLASRLIFNIVEGERTQIIALFSEKRKVETIRPMLINYIGRDCFTDWGKDPDFDELM